LISSLGNIGVTLYNTGHDKEAPKALELCCHAIWAHVRFSYRGLSSRTEENRTMEHLPKDTLKDIIFDAFARLAKMVEILHRCGSKRTHEIIAMSLSKLLADDMSEYFDSSLILIKLWVKITCKDFEGNQGVDRPPLLYHSLLDCSSPIPRKLIGLILEQELLAYGLMETRGSKFCAAMQIRVIDVLLDKIYYSEEHCLQRSRFLIRKAGALRACGAQNIESCLKSLSEAISLLKTISEDSSQSNTTVINQLAIAQCLYAHCTLEGNPGCEVIFKNINSALSSWSKVETFDYSSPGSVLQRPSQTIVPLLCSLVDLLAMKVRP
jgi:separase